MTRGRIVLLAVLVAGLTFGAFGGEYGTFDWWELKQRVRDERAAIERLTLEVDSLRREAEAIERDPATQERVARELFGMIRPGEILYRVETVKP
ncbi:MAG: septum formation initiator family protein [Gemmatimonadetes bacterium]|nr:septum formation initiator family protein [Gemmatimonadota bacterium]MBI2403301.1 septum formation initiator family protein [Gemmatimonadota bacterium]